MRTGDPASDQDPDAAVVLVSPQLGVTSGPISVAPPGRRPRAVRAALGLLGLLLFVVALQLLKEGAVSYGRPLIDGMNVVGPAGALGLGWLMAYLFLSGSPVAAVAISFFASGALTPLQTFAMITGSRLGAAFVILFIGFVYHLRGHRRADSVAVGVLALLTTAAIYLPALIPGAYLIASGVVAPVGAAGVTPLDSALELLVGPLVALLTASLPGWGLLLVGVATLLVGFNCFDHALPAVDLEHGRFGRLGQLAATPAAMFALGAAITCVTLSVSVSLALLVPLVARGGLRRQRSVPYIMGANITTFVDTLVAALVVGGAAAFTIVLIEMVSVAALSLIVLALGYRPFEAALLAAQERVTRSWRGLGLFVAILLSIPLLLLLSGR